MGKKTQLDDDDFPVKADQDKIKTRSNAPLATAENDETAEQIAERLNDDALRRHEDNWSA
jgi:hypothetical protein